MKDLNRRNSVQAVNGFIISVTDSVYRSTGEGVSADTTAVATFPEEVMQIIDEGGYSAKKVFNVDKTELFWKHMSE